MEDKIKSYLSQLEKEKGIEILLACETGSRAWGFPSTDSDYDVRLIYKHNKDWYLNLFEKKDSIERFYEDNEIDISGWDLRKSLRLLWKSNASLLERIQSPFVYEAKPDFISDIYEIGLSSYSRIVTMHHYLSMAKKMYAELKAAPQYKLKKFFYTLRSTIACLWILEKEVPPPIEFIKMMNGLDIPNEITSRIHDLIQVKAKVNESYFHQDEQEIFEFINSIISRASLESNHLPASKATTTAMNEFFLKQLGS